MQTYFILDYSGTVVNAIVCDISENEPNPEWVSQSDTPDGVWIGWKTPNSGETWNPPEMLQSEDA